MLLLSRSLRNHLKRFRLESKEGACAGVSPQSSKPQLTEMFIYLLLCRTNRLNPFET